MNQSNDVKEFISLIENLDINTSFDVFIPSLQKKIKFKQLTTEQLKLILKTVIDSPIYNTEFTLTFNNIIKTNCLDETINTDNLTIYDKLIIFFSIRLESISHDYTFQFTEEEVKSLDLQQPKKVVSLKEHFDNFLEKQYNFTSEHFEYNNCVVVCNLPTLVTENKLEKELHKNTKIDIGTPEELRSVVGETFINEITKYIQTISIDSTTVDLLSQPFKTRINLVEKLPTNLINKVIKYIEKYRNITKELTSIIITVPTNNQNNIEVTKDISLDATFFNV
jgi:hypothetical protein